MGVLPKEKKRVYFPNSDSDELIIDSAEDSASDNDVAPNLGRQPVRSVVASPRATRKFCGHKLTLKKGRRSRHRYENERILFSSVGIDTEETPEGWDIAHEPRSHFADLLKESNKALLDDFVTEVEDFSSASAELKRERKGIGTEVKTPEEAYLSIHQNVRAAMKKHLPWGMLEGLDDEIRTFFESNPKSKFFVMRALSSYERLLAHACSMYNQLKSQSYDENGVRTLKIENPCSTFKPMEPSLPSYLKTRCH